GDLSRGDVVDHTPSHAEELAPRVGASARLTPDHARSQVAAQQQRPTRIEPHRPVARVPCPLEQLTRAAGLPFEAGSRALRGTIAQATDGIAQLLSQAGTIMIGKTTTPEFGLPPYTEPDTGPAARNPWDLRRTAGGSSGGAAAAVAAGIAPV